jgi:hypothetical protein
MYPVCERMTGILGNLMRPLPITIQGKRHRRLQRLYLVTHRYSGTNKNGQWILLHRPF